MMFAILWVSLLLNVFGRMKGVNVSQSLQAVQTNLAMTRQHPNSHRMPSGRKIDPTGRKRVLAPRSAPPLFQLARGRILATLVTTSLEGKAKRHRTLEHNASLKHQRGVRPAGPVEPDARGVPGHACGPNFVGLRARRHRGMRGSRQRQQRLGFESERDEMDRIRVGQDLTRSRTLRTRARVRLRKTVVTLTELQELVEAVPLAKGMIVLELTSVTVPSATQYLSQLGLVSKRDLTQLSPQEVAAIFTNWMNTMSLKGKNPWLGEKTLAAFFSAMPRALRRLRGWRRLCLGFGKRPYDWPIWCAMAMLLAR